MMLTMLSIVVLILCLAVMLIGLAGTVAPVLPGIPIIWVGMLIYGWYSGWAAYGLMSMLVIGFLVVLSVAVDQLASIIGAKKFGATKAGMIGSVVGAIVGFLVGFGLPGLVIGTFGGAVVFEIVFSRRNLKESMASGTGALVGFLAGSLFKFMLGAGFIVYFMAMLIITALS